MKISDLKPGQEVFISNKKYTYEGIKKIRGKIGKLERIVFQGSRIDDQILYPLTAGTRTLVSEEITVKT